MIITKNKLFYGLLIYSLVVNLVIILNLNFLLLKPILASIFLLTLPGILILLILKLEKIIFWERLVYVISLSIAFLMFLGLAVNWILPWLHITNKPLSLIPLLLSFDIILSIFGFIAHKRNKNFTFKIKFPRANLLNAIFFTIPIIFPALSILGANILNNGGPNLINMAIFAGIAAQIALIVLFRKRLNENVFPWTIIMMGFSLLLMFSLRSLYVSGWDVFQELEVFKLTKEAYLWNINTLRNAYNSCLSITILPTFFSVFTNVNDAYIFKFIFQLIFSIVPLIVYLISRKITNNFYAFLSSIFFISQYQFIIYSSWIRQEISLIFFSSLFLILLENKISTRVRKYLFIIFLISMVVSHYSTTYLCWAVLIFTYAASLFYKVTYKRKYFLQLYEKLKIKTKYVKEFNYFINFKLLLIMTILMFMWYAQITSSADNIINFSNRTLSNLNLLFSSEARALQVSSPLDQFNIFYQNNMDFPKMVDTYVKEVSTDYQNKKYIKLYPENTFINEKIEVTYSSIASLKINDSYALAIHLFGEIIQKIIKIFMVLGLFYLLYLYKKKDNHREHVILASISLALLLVLTIIPYGTISYNLARAYQQFLIILSVAVVIGASKIVSIVTRKFSIYILGVIFILYFLYIPGFIGQIVGGSAIYPYLNNYGSSYNDTYAHAEEISSAIWLSGVYDNKNFVYADHSGMFRLSAFAKPTIKIIEDVIPQTIDRNSYVYARYANVVYDEGILPSEQYFQKADVYYKFPLSFLSNNKNLVYNNGGSYIFK